MLLVILHDCSIQRCFDTSVYVVASFVVTFHLLEEVPSHDNVISCDATASI